MRRRWVHGFGFVSTARAEVCSERVQGFLEKGSVFGSQCKRQGFLLARALQREHAQIERLLESKLPQSALQRMQARAQ